MLMLHCKRTLILVGGGLVCFFLLSGSRSCMQGGLNCHAVFVLPLWRLTQRAVMQQTCAAQQLVQAHVYGVRVVW
jgi:hypothetical protein